MMGAMDGQSGNRRIAVALLALVGLGVALHVHAVRVHGVRPERKVEPKAGVLHRGAKGQEDRRGTQSGRILRHIQEH
jgi:hypothetical protein